MMIFAQDEGFLTNLCQMTDFVIRENGRSESMGKYVIESKFENTRCFLEVACENGEPYFFINRVDSLTPYTEPDLEQIRKEAYKDGYNAGFGRKIDASYQEGLSDAWEAVRKIYSFDLEEREELFHDSERFNIGSICEAYSASEAIEKIQQYEQRQEEQIQIGDEVIRHYKNEFMEGDDAPSIFLSEEDGNFRCLAFNGRSIMIAEYPKNQYRKTGRHFPEIAEVLAKMKETDNG
jgi:hypothetical protein